MALDFSELGGQPAAPPQQATAPPDAQQQPAAAAPAPTNNGAAANGAGAKLDFSSLGGQKLDFSSMGGEKVEAPAAAANRAGTKPDIPPLEQDKGFWKGAWDETLGPIWEQAKQEQDKVDKMGFGDRLLYSVKSAIEHTPPPMLYHTVAHAIHAAYQEGKKAAGHGMNALSETGSELESLGKGDFAGAAAHGRTASGEGSQALGHGLATVVPIVGPAAADIGEEAGQGNVKHASGRAAGLIGTVVAPEVLEGTAAKLAGTVDKNVAAATTTSEAETAAANARTTAKQAQEDAAQAATKAETEKQAAAETLKESAAKNQGQARQNITNSARGTTENALDEINKAREGAPGAKPIDSKAEAAGVNSFGEAADTIQKHAKEIYQKLDDVSQGQFTNLREAIKANKEAMYSSGDKNASLLDKRLNSDMDALFAKYADQVGPNDLKAATAAWRTSKVLEDINGAVEKSIQGAPESIAQRAGTPRQIVGTQLSKRLNKMLENTPQADVEKAIGKEGLDNLYRIADMTSTPLKATQLTEAAQNVAKQLKNKASEAKAAADMATEKARQLAAPKEPIAKTIVKHMASKSLAASGGAMAARSVGIPPSVGAFAGIAAEQMTRSVLQKALVSPRIGRMLQDAISVGASSRVYAPLIAQAIRKEADETNLEGKKK